MKTVTYLRDARRTLGRMPRTDRERIVAKIEQYARDPASLANNVRTLTGTAFLRLRVGDWRVIMSDEGEVLIIVKVGSRGSVYE
ncbi:type II toxin-antitoxin system RelE/ParE family toxin [Acuticoccus sp. I52.16.1]|uniref:type II toxin-antitoxin system RelE family toxin n=1 Tax=Acuticoccus sp. I52.16.1 TaxID=2928472 RepID=UPI001FD3707C|nr:type II toxin-antitoxin system RelE/ParE family toxin [Acuticoccus sp. I52.16.1]UOM37177.1 type II toxin-antitoxin system RelE/ParE family toxin [Acuticoccus sp. I52.16.1]